MSEPLCLRLDDLLARREADRLDPAGERLLREHLAACPACAAEALRRDPVLLFAREAAPDLLTPEARERFVSGVLSAAGAAKARRRIGAARTGHVLRIAASLLLAASVAGIWFARSGGSGAPSAPAPTVAVARDARPSAPTETLPAVEEIGGEGSVVYQFPATSPGEPTVVFVVDRNADI